MKDTSISNTITTWHLMPKDVKDIFLMREMEVFHNTRNKEIAMCSAIAMGDEEKYLQLMMSGDLIVGNNSDNLLTLMKYNLITLYGIAARICMENGMPDVEAYSFSDTIVKIIDASNCFTDFDAIAPVFSNMLKRMREIKFNSTDNRNINAAINYISRHLHQQIELDEVAQASGLSRSYLSSLFKKLVGESMFSYVRRMRIEEAKALFHYSLLSTTEVAYVLQFASESYFCKCFKQEVGMTPSEYKKHSQLSSK